MEFYNNFTQEMLLKLGTPTPEQLALVKQCRGKHNRLGFCYQLIFVKITNRLPAQQPLEIVEEILVFAGLQTNIRIKHIKSYQKRRQTISEHQNQIKTFLGLRKFDEQTAAIAANFIFTECYRLDQISLILIKTEQFLREQNILAPAQDTLERLIVTQREKARRFIYTKLYGLLSAKTILALDDLLTTDNSKYSKLQKLKNAPKTPSVEAIIALIEKLNIIKATNVTNLNLEWLNNNYQRRLAKYALRFSAHRLKQTEVMRRYAILTCFLRQTYNETTDYIVDTYFKLIQKIYSRAENQVNDATKKQRKKLKGSLVAFNIMSSVILDESIIDSDVRKNIFKRISKESITTYNKENEAWLTGKYSHAFKLVIQRFSYLRQFAPLILERICFQSEGDNKAEILKAIDLLKDLNKQNKRKLPQDTSIAFISKKIRPMIRHKGQLNRHAWECALLVAVRDEIKSGNISVVNSKRYGHFDDFFMPYEEWNKKRSTFFKRADLPENPQDVPAYLTNRSNKAFDKFFESEATNKYASVENGQWVLSVDEAETLNPEAEAKLDKLKDWLAKHMRNTKLPELLIEVDNDLHLTDYFMPSTLQNKRNVEDICAIIATWMAYGCFFGPIIMSKLTQEVSYHQIKSITDWQLTDEALRQALVKTVNAISALDVTRSWGEGKTSSSDAARYEYKHKTLQRTYSTKFGDFALEFYTFVADNYAPFYSCPIECTERDAPYVLDGQLYNETELPLEEHYTDTHGYMEINFTGFTMLGRRFNPRIRNIKRQHIYRIDKERDYGSLSPLVCNSKSTIHLDWIVEHWDRMGHFYASLESGYTTASTAMKRLASFTGKNHFYRANRELGRVIKTENILNHMCDPIMRRNRRRGLLKGEQIHQLARNIAYGKRGRISARDFQGQKNTCSCLILIMADIIYWQAKEITRVINECNPEAAGIDLSMLEYISPIEWDNLVLYGQYVIDKRRIKR